MEISEIKTSLTITRVLNHYNHQADKNHRINCPFHNDKTPSMQVYEKTNTVYCFSSNCKTHGKSLDVIDFIMHKEEITKHEAILKAVEMLGGENKNTTSQHLQLAKSSHPQISKSSNSPILTKIFHTFQGGVKSKRMLKAKDYLKQRNLDEYKIEVGYNSGQFHHLGRLSDEEMQACIDAALLTEYKGVIPNSNSQKTYTAFAKECIVFPLKDPRGNIVSLYGRSIIDNKNSKHYYLKNRSGLYPAYPSPQAKKIILTEAIIDAASLLQISEITKEYEILSLFGTNGFTQEHSEAISQLKQLQEIIFFFDGDQAGEKAAEKYSKDLNQLLNFPLSRGNAQRAKGVTISQVQTPKDEDINSLLQGHEVEIFTHLLNNRKFLFSIENKNPVNPVQTKPESSNPQISKSSHSQISNLNTKNQELLTYTTPELRITILGGIRISGLDRLKVTLKIRRVAADNKGQSDQNQIPVRYSLDLYHAKQVEQLTETIAQQLEISSSKAMKIISKMTTELEVYRQKRMEALKPKTAENYKMSDEETHAAVRYLKSKKLLTNTKNDIAASGIIGEQSNAMTGFIVNISRKRSKPLHVMYLGSSGSGKTHLQEGLAQLIPKEDRIEATGLSDQSLYYEGLKLKGKILFIEDLDGAENVMYIIRELQSKGRITKRVAWRDNKGNTKTIEVVAEGPVVISSCTTKEKLYEDNANRCILLYIDQSREQDKKVMDYMKAKSTGKIIESEQEEIRKRMQNIQRMLKPIKVYNPFANLIELPPEVFKPRRSLPLLLGFIESLTFYHQYQRQRVYADSNGNPIEPYIQSTVEDIENSFALMKEVLFSKSDELSKAAREFLERLKKEVKQGDTFYTKEIRKKFRISASGSQRYMSELQSYGYVKIKNGNRYRGFEYIITDYSEYENLRQSIEKLFEAILLSIRKISNPVAQSSPVPSLGYLNDKEPVV